MISVPFPLSYEVWCSGDLKFEMTVCMMTITGVFLKLPLFCHCDCCPQMPRYLQTHGCGYVFSIYYPKWFLSIRTL